MEKINGYSSDKNVQMLISLMLEHGVRKVVVSPGTTHMEIVAGLQYNGNFEMYSCIDERGAAYLACGMAEKSNEAVAIICTESVASRNYNSPLTDAYYRQLPILAITGLHGYSQIGHLHSQIIDRSVSPTDTFKLKVQLPVIKSAEDIWMSNVLINKALLELKHRGGGPVHIDLPWSENKDFSSKKLCNSRVIHRYSSGEALPKIGGGVKTAILLGTHSKFSATQVEAIDAFCGANDAVVFCGHTSGYRGKYAVISCLIAKQGTDNRIFQNINTLIHIGGPAVDEDTARKLASGAKQVWRVNPDGEIRDTFKKLTCVFEMEEEEFFKQYSDTEKSRVPKQNYLEECLRVVHNIHVPVDKLPFTNVYIASVMSKQIPKGALVHFGMSNSIRAWSLFELADDVSGDANSGTRGIDGVLPAFVGASHIDPKWLCFCVLGDLAFFYGMNSLHDEPLGKNIRILLINDNGGGLMKTSSSQVHQLIGDADAEAFLVAGGHFAGKKAGVVKAYAEELGFEYLEATDKESFNSACKRFLMTESAEKPMLLEAFTDAQQERNAFDLISNIEKSPKSVFKKKLKRMIGPKGIMIIKKRLVQAKNRKQ